MDMTAQNKTDLSQEDSMAQEQLDRMASFASSFVSALAPAIDNEAYATPAHAIWALEGATDFGTKGVSP